MKVSIPAAQLGAAHLAAVAIDQLVVTGPATVDRLTLDDTRVSLHAPQIAVTDLVLELDLALKVSWHIDTVVFKSTDSRTFHFHLASQPLDFRVPPVVLPPPLTPPPLVLTIAHTQAQQLAVTVGPVTGIQAGPVDATGITATDLRAPAGGFTLAGLGLGHATLTGVAVPAVELVAAAIDQAVASVHLPHLVVGGISLPRGLGGQLDLGGLEAQPQLASAGDQISLFNGHITFSFTATPTPRLTIAKLAVAHTGISLDLGQVTLDNLTAALALRKIAVSKLRIDTLAVPTLDLG